MDDALGQGSSRWVPNQRSQQTWEVEETVGDHHHQREQGKMEEQQKTEQKEERGRMAVMCAFEWVFLVHLKMFCGGQRNYNGCRCGLNTEEEVKMRNSVKKVAAASARSTKEL